MLTSEETKRYNRQIKLDGFGVHSQENLKAAKVLVVGLGGLGSPVSLYLAASGVGTIGIIDFDKIDYSNLSRQILFSENEVGFYKIDVAFEKLKKLNSYIKIIPFKEKLTSENAPKIFGQFSLIVDGSDNFETRYLVNDVCVKLGIPFVHGSVSGFEGLVSLFNSSPKSPCFRCLHPEIPIDGKGCSDFGVIPTVAGLVGVQMANYAIQFLIGRGYSIDKEVLFFKEKDFISFILEKDSNCPVCGKGQFIEKVKYQEIDSIEFRKLKDSFEIIDIREENEFKELNLGGINVPYSSFNVEKIDHLKEKELLILCYCGERSKEIMETLKKNNFEKIFHLKGGIREAILN